MQSTWRVALSALLTLVIAVAPLLAQVVMASHAHAASLSPASAAKHGHHRHSDSTSVIVGGHNHGVHSNAVHSHDHADAPGHSHEPADVEPMVGHSSGGAQGAPMGHHDHSDGPNAGCCGAFCHSLYVLAASAPITHALVRPTLAWSNLRLLAAVSPDQPQRPPSHPLSL
jgi:hypothetical protein